MINELTTTDGYVRSELMRLNLEYSSQKSSISYINEALKGASKTGKNGIGQPDFLCTYSNPEYLVIIEDKLSNSKLVYKNEITDEIETENLKIVDSYAVNGALYYGKKILENQDVVTKIICIGITGSEKNHEIESYYLDKDHYKLLGNWNDLENLKYENIIELISTTVLKKKSKIQLEEEQIINLSNELNEELWKYNIQEQRRALLISGLVLALKYDDFRDTYRLILNGIEYNSKDEIISSDGMKIYEAISKSLYYSTGNSRKEKVEVLLSEFSFIRDEPELSKIKNELNMSILRDIVIKLDSKVMTIFETNKFDVLGKFYSRFLKYASGGDQSQLGIVLTPTHVTDLFSKLADLKSDDVVIDPCAGTGGFLVSAMNYMIDKVNSDEYLSSSEKEEKILDIKRNNLLGIETQRNLYSIATTNMILRGDGKSNLMHDNCFDISETTLRRRRLKQPNIGFINPPYSLAKKTGNTSLSEWNFILNMLSLMREGGTGIAIVPLSVAIGSTEYDNEFKKEFLKKHTLEAVISMPKELFYPVGTTTCIMMFKAKVPHNLNDRVKFINFEDDGCIKHKKLGRITSINTENKVKELVDIFNNRIDSGEENILYRTLGTKNEPHLEEWNHSYYYINNKIPESSDFEDKIKEFLKFQFNMKIENKDYLFSGVNNEI